MMGSGIDIYGVTECLINTMWVVQLLATAESLFWLQIANDVVTAFDSIVTGHPVLIVLSSVIVAGLIFAAIPRMNRRVTLFLAGIVLFFLLVAGSDGILTYLVRQGVLAESTVIGPNGGVTPTLQVPVMLVLFGILGGGSYILETRYRARRTPTVED